MKLEYLREFIYLAECLNMTETANRFYMTQPALAKHLSAIENEYQATLIERSTHGCVLTKAGEAVYAAAKEILSVYDSSAKKVREIRDGLSGSVRVGSILTSGMSLLSDRLILFCEKFPNINVEFVPMSGPDMISGLENGDIDIAFMNRYAAVPDDRYLYTFFSALHLKAYIGKHHPLSNRDSVSLCDLKGSSFIYPENIAPYMDLVLAMLKNGGITSPALVRCDSFETIPFLLTKNFTCFIASDDPGMYRLLEQYCVCLDFNDRSLDIPIYLISRKDTGNTCIKHFLDMCANPAEP